MSTQAHCGQVLRIDPRTGAKTVLADLYPGLDNLTFADGRLFVSNFSGEITEILAPGKTRSVLPGGFNWPLDLAVGSDGRVYIADGPYLHVAAGDGTVQPVGMLFTPGFPGYTRGLTASGDGEFTVTTSSGQVARFWPDARRKRRHRRRFRPALRRGDRRRWRRGVRRARHRPGAGGPLRPGRGTGDRSGHPGRRGRRPRRRRAGRPRRAPVASSSSAGRHRSRWSTDWVARTAFSSSTERSTWSTSTPRRSSRSTWRPAIATPSPPACRSALRRESRPSRCWACRRSPDRRAPSPASRPDRTARSTSRPTPRAACCAIRRRS